MYRNVEVFIFCLSLPWAERSPALCLASSEVSGFYPPFAGKSH